MAYGVQINTSGGIANVVDISTPLLIGSAILTLPANSSPGYTTTAPYPVDWDGHPLIGNRDNTFVYIRWSRTFTGTPPDPYGTTQPAFFEMTCPVTFSDIGREVTMGLYYNVYDSVISIEVFFFQRGTA